MPIYEYVCESCTYRFEVKQRVTDEPIKSCTRCGQSVNKVISAPAIMFKGSGWYVTDYSDKLKAPSSEAANGNGQGEAKPAQPAAPAQTPATPSTSSPTTAPAAGNGTAAASTTSTTSTPSAS